MEIWLLVVGYSQFTKKAKESNDNTELHQYATLLQAALVDGEEVVTIEAVDNVTDSAGTYKLTYEKVNNANAVKLYKADSAGNYTANAMTSIEGAVITEIIKTMLIDPTEKIDNATLTATLSDAGTLELTYQHHLTGNDNVTWTFAY